MLNLLYCYHHIDYWPGGVFFFLIYIYKLKIIAQSLLNLFFPCVGTCCHQGEGLCNYLLHFIRKSCKVSFCPRSSPPPFLWLCIWVTSDIEFSYKLLLLFFFFRLIAKYRPTMPVLSVVIPRLKTNQLRWTFTGAFEVYIFFLTFIYFRLLLQQLYLSISGGC